MGAALVAEQERIALAVIENARFALSFSSGVAASDAVIRLLVPGDEVIAANDMYGGTFRLFSKIFEKAGIHFHYVNMQDPENIRANISAKTKMIWTETPTNPLMNIVDLSALASLAREKKLLLCVDNTFASPYLQNPLDLGADIVIHSATKYLGGHSDVIHGCLMMNDPALREQLYFIQKACGAVPGPQDCFLGDLEAALHLCSFADVSARPRPRRAPTQDRSRRTGPTGTAGSARASCPCRSGRRW
jgi:cystathionine beta-lyase/cystathionine gamma-synthase